MITKPLSLNRQLFVGSLLLFSYRFNKLIQPRMMKAAALMKHKMDKMRSVNFEYFVANT